MASNFGVTLMCYTHVLHFGVTSEQTLRYVIKEPLIGPRNAVTSCLLPQREVGDRVALRRESDEVEPPHGAERTELLQRRDRGEGER